MKAPTAMKAMTAMTMEIRRAQAAKAGTTRQGV